MAVPVGSAYAEFYLEYSDLQGDVDAIKASLGELRKANDDLLQSIRDTGAGMAGAMKQVQSEVASLKPLDPIVNEAKRAKKELGKQGAAAEIKKDVIGELKSLKSALESSNTYAPIIQQAKAAGASADTLRSKLEQLQAAAAAAKGTGLRREDLEVFFDDQGRIRDSRAVPYAQADAATRDRPALQRPGGKVMDTNAQRAAIERVLENVPRGTEAANLGSDVEAAKALAETARDAYSAVSDLEREVADLRAELMQAGKVRVDIGQSFIDAEAALSNYEDEQRKVIQANQDVATSEQKIEQILREIAALQAASNAEEGKGDTADLARYAAILEGLQQKEVELGQAHRTLAGQQALLDHANEGLAQSTEMAAYAQERLNKAIGAEPSSRRATAATGEPEAPNLDKQIQREEDSNRRIAEQKIAHEQELERIQAEATGRRVEAELRATAQVEAARLQSVALVEAETRRGETSRYAVDVELQAATEKAQIESVGKIEHARIGAADRQLRQEQKITADKEKAELASTTRISAAKIAVQGRLDAIAERARLKREERERKAAEKAAAKQATVIESKNGLNDIEAATVARNRARKTEESLAAAIQIVEARLNDVNLSLKQRINLERLLAQIENTKPKSAAQQQKENQRGFLGMAQGQLIQFAGALGLATGAAELLASGVRALRDGFDISRETEEASRTVGVFINNADRGNRVLDTAVKFGREYGFVQREMTEASRVLAPQIRNSNVALEKQFEIIARLASRNPQQGFEGAAFATGELAAGDIQSLRDRFNIPGAAARKMKADVEAGNDVFLVLDETLNQLGITLEALDQRMIGTSGQVRQFASGWDQLKTAVAGLYTEGVPVLGFLGKLMAGLAQAARIASLLSRIYSEMAVNTIKAFKLPPQLQILVDGMKAAVTVGKQYIGLLPAVEESLKLMAGGSRVASAETERVGDALSVASNRMQEGKISATGYAKELHRIAEESNIDLDIRAAALPPEVIGNLEKAKDLLDDYQRAAQRDPGFASANLPQIVAVADEVARLKRLSPIVIDVELRTQYINEGIQAINAVTQEATRAVEQVQEMDAAHTRTVAKGRTARTQIWLDYMDDISRMNREFYENQGKADRAFNAQMARQARDFARSLARSDRDFRQGQQRAYRDYLEGQAKSIRDYERGRARALRDHEQEEAKSEAEHVDNLVKIREDGDKRLVEIQKETRKRLQDLRGDYDVDRKRATEDFELERAVLLAQGKLTEARVLESRHAVEARRAGEDFARSSSDVLDEGATQADEARTQRDEALDEARKAHEKERKERQDSWDQMRADQASDFALQLEDARQAYVKGRDDAAADRKQARDDAIADNALARADAISDRETARNEAAADFEKAKQDRLDAAKKQYDDLKAAQKDEEDAYKESRQKILDNLDTFVASQKTKLQEARDDMIETRRLMEEGYTQEQAELIVKLQRSNADWQKVLGDMKNIAGFEGVAAGTEWMRRIAESLLKGAAYVDQLLQPQFTSPGPRRPPAPVNPLSPPINPNRIPGNDREPRDTRGTSTGDYTRLYELPPSGAQAAAAQRQPLVIHLQAPVIMDGKVVGQVMMPYVMQHLDTDLDLAVDTNEAVYTPGVHQQAFRRPIS